MQAVRLKGPYEFYITEETMPVVHNDSVLLEIQAVGICGSDLHRYHGMKEKTEDPDFHVILGHEFSARVIETGKQVTRVRAGDRVAVEAGINCEKCEWCLKGFANLCPNVKFCGMPPYDGAFRQYMAWPGRLVYKLPDSLTFEDGVMVEVFGIALHSIRLAHMTPGQTVAILGSGPIGLSILHMLIQASGPSLVFATDRLSYRLDIARTFGADHDINADQANVTDRIQEQTNGRGVDVVYECAGEESTYYQAVDICAPGGKVILVGINENNRNPFDASVARRKGLTLKYVRRSNMTYEEIIPLLEKGIIHSNRFITHHFSLNDISKAFEIVNGYQDGVIKACIHPHL